MAQRVLDTEPRFDGELFSPDAAIQRARSGVAQGKRPVVIADAQDNPSAGGKGARITLSLGGKFTPLDNPLTSDFVVEKLSDGIFRATGTYYGQRHMDIGASACLQPCGCWPPP